MLSCREMMWRKTGLKIGGGSAHYHYTSKQLFLLVTNVTNSFFRI